MIFLPFLPFNSLKAVEVKEDRETYGKVFRQEIPMLYSGIGSVWRPRIHCERVGLWEFEVLGWNEGSEKVNCLGLKRASRKKCKADFGLDLRVDQSEEDLTKTTFY